MANKKSKQAKKETNQPKRITFRPKSEAKRPPKEVELHEVEAEMVEEVAEDMPAPAPVSVPELVEGRAVAIGAGQTPVFAALRWDGDERQILVAERGLIWLPAGEDQFRRLLRLMSLLSDAFELPSQLTLRHHAAGDVLIGLTPRLEGQEWLSHFYDQVDTISRMVQAELYIGQENTFVRYRDGYAPRGYDIPAFTNGDHSEQLHLIGRFVSHHWAIEGLYEQSLADFCLQIAPSWQAVTAIESECYLLAPAPLYALLARYLRRHQLAYRLAHLAHGDDKLMLFAVQPFDTSASSAHRRLRASPPTPQPQIPHFILHYLASLSRVVLLTAVQSDPLTVPEPVEGSSGGAGPKILLQWQYKYPLHLPHVAAAFDEKQWLLFMASHYPNLCLNVAPNFIAGQELTQIEPKFAHHPLRFPPPSTSRLQLPVHLRPRGGPIPPVSALLLNKQELAWLPPLLYRLPAGTFSQYQLYQSQERAILLSTQQALEGIPFGTPFHRLSNSQLFIPQQQRLVPALPLHLLYDTLNIQPDSYTFLTLEKRLDIPTKHFAPLSRRLIASPSQKPQLLRVRAKSSWPPLRWEAPTTEASDAQASAKKERSLFDRLLGREEQRPNPPKTPQPSASAHWSQVKVW